MPDKDKTEAREVSVEPTRWVIAHPETDFGSIEVVASLAYDLLEKRVKELELDERMASREVERQLKINNELRERVQKLEAALDEIARGQKCYPCTCVCHNIADQILAEQEKEG